MSSLAYRNVTPDWVRSTLEAGGDITIVDVRTPQEFLAYHIPQAILCPVDVLPSRLDEFPADAKLVMICEHGIRSEMAARYLAGCGYSDVATMDGGMAAYSGEVVNG